MKLEAGVHKISAAEYHADPAPAPSFSAGIAHIVANQSLKHAWFAHPRLNPDYQPEEDTAFDLGSCAHAVLLEGGEAIEQIEAADWRTKAAKEARERARANGKIPILAHKMGAILAMAEAARIALSECELGPIDLSQGVAERTLLWQENGTWCRARPDWMRNDRQLLLDYKSTSGSAHPSAWIRTQMVPMGFDIQSIHYSQGNGATGGTAVPLWVFLVQENYPPFACSFVSLAPGMREIAYRKWDEALQYWKTAIRTNEWPGYSRRIAYAEPLPWQIAEHEERGFDIDKLEVHA